MFILAIPLRFGFFSLLETIFASTIDWKLMFLRKKMSSSLLQTMLQPYARQSSSSLDGVVKIQFLFMVMKYGPYQLNVSFSLFGKKINCIYKLFS